MSSVRWHFFVFRNSVEKFCVSWAFPLIECVAVWTLKLPVPHTDVLKPTSHKAFLRNYWKPKKLAANNCHKLRRNCLWFLRSHGKVIPLPSLLSFSAKFCIISFQYEATTFTLVNAFHIFQPQTSHLLQLQMHAHPLLLIPALNEHIHIWTKQQ